MGLVFNVLLTSHATGGRCECARVYANGMEYRMDRLFLTYPLGYYCFNRRLKVGGVRENNSLKSAAAATTMRWMDDINVCLCTSPPALLSPVLILI